MAFRSPGFSTLNFGPSILFKGEPFTLEQSKFPVWMSPLSSMNDTVCSGYCHRLFGTLFSGLWQSDSTPFPSEELPHKQ